MKQQKTSRQLSERINALAPPRVRLQLLILLIGQCVFYWGARLLTRNRFHHCMALPLDAKIPLLPWTVLIYFGCFLSWALNYTMILRTEPEGKHRFFIAELAGKFISAVMFIILPTTLNRPEVIGSGVFRGILRMLYVIDAPDCLFPSLHCYVSWMCVIGLRGKPQISKAYRAGSIVIAVLVFGATLTTKQHVIVDVAAGIVLAELAWLLSGCIENYRGRRGGKTERKI